VQEIETPTTVGTAMRAAGFQTAAERLRSLMAAAIRIGKGIPEPSLVVFEQTLLADDDAAALIWELVAEVRGPAMLHLFRQVLHEMRERNKAKSSPGSGHKGHDAQPPHAQPAARPHQTQPSATGRSAIDTQSRDARPPAGPSTAAQAAVERAKRCFLLDHVINGKQLAQLSAGELRAWGLAQGAWVRFAALVTEGMPDSMLIGERSDDEIMLCWKLATSAPNA
jgi:hypothetical protein